MFLPLLLLGWGLLSALSGSVPLPPIRRRKETVMGDIEDGDGERVLSKKLSKYLIDTMRLSDPQEVARRARKLARDYPQTARIVMRRARELQAAKRAAKSPTEIYQAVKASEPLAVFNLKWTRFIKSMVRDVSDVSATNHVGYFSFAWSRLVKLGLAKDLRKEEKQTPSGVRKLWTADLIPPPTLDEFLKSSKLQYDAFVKSMLDYLPTLLADRYREFIGKEIEGKRVTLSGLLAVVHQAGIDGLKSWLANPADRTKYPHTTAAFVKSSEIF